MRRTVLISSTWLVGTVVATLLAFAAVSLVVSGVRDGSGAATPGSRRTAVGTPATSYRQPDRSGAARDSTAPDRSAPTTAAKPASSVAPSPPGPTTPGTPTSSGPRQATVVAPAPSAGTSSAPGATPSAGGGQPATNQVLSSPGGVATIRCDGNALTLVSVSPADGYSMTDRSVNEGEAEVQFTSSDRDYEIKARCLNGALITGD